MANVVLPFFLRIRPYKRDTLRMVGVCSDIAVLVFLSISNADQMAETLAVCGSVCVDKHAERNAECFIVFEQHCCCASRKPRGEKLES